MDYSSSMKYHHSDKKSTKFFSLHDQKLLSYEYDDAAKNINFPEKNKHIRSHW